MSHRHRRPARTNSSDDDEDDNNSSSRQRPSSSEGAGKVNSKRSINEALRLALELAANPGDGDEEPEVLPAPAVEPEPRGDGDEEVDGDIQETAADSPTRKAPASAKGSVASTSHDKGRVDSDDDDDFVPYEDEPISSPRISSAATPLPLSNIRERAKYIPLRLTYEERKSLRLVAAAINVSDYTNIVDINFKQRARRQHTQLQQIVAFLTGLVSAMDYEQGQQVLKDRNFALHEPMLRDALEICRRYKITNPDKLRSEYGKLIYLMQDSLSESIQPLLDITLHKPVHTVYQLLHVKNGLALLDDPLVTIATNEILPDKNKSRQQIQQEIRKKEKAAEHLVKKYQSSTLSGEMIRACLYSLGDNVSFLNSNRKPVDECIALLKEYFDPRQPETGYNLGIHEGNSGARLTHNHETQYHYVLQSLTLWSNILEDMFRLWYLAEQDLLNSSAVPYELKDTGQGLQRVQKAPRVYSAMHDILAHTQRQLSLSSIGNVHTVSSGNSGFESNWVGTSVVHLGDHNVPNALVFIDKYAQVSRILGPLIATLNQLEKLVEENSGLDRYIQSYGGIRKAKKDVLHDFFTHGFDGSGGDNFFDAGSCIDGRLTSAWHWCSQLSSKPFYPLFRLTGFASFDGEFDK